MDEGTYRGPKDLICSPCEEAENDRCTKAECHLRHNPKGAMPDEKIRSNWQNEIHLAVPKTECRWNAVGQCPADAEECRNTHNIADQNKKEHSSKPLCSAT